MKKTIAKPENWQDFESLCKKLWGEIWEIPNSIKKHGRLGQEQSGVDIYGIPKGETNYWGIQCKGKDDYTKAKITEQEIIAEIKRARQFEPQLKVYILATTANKDTKIEQFVRKQDIYSRSTGGFEIYLFCWEDIVDLIENNLNTYNWYQKGIGYKGKYDFTLYFNEFQEDLTLFPQLERKVTKHKLIERKEKETADEMLTRFNALLKPRDLDILSIFNSNKINKSWCDFTIIMANTGSVVIEDWRLSIRFIEGVARIDNGHFLMPKISLTEYINNETLSITYRPIENRPLIQNDNRYFKTSILPEVNAGKIVMEWELLARDYNIIDKVEINISPVFVDVVEYKDVYDKEDVTNDEVSLSYYVIEEKDK